MILLSISSTTPFSPTTNRGGSLPDFAVFDPRSESRQKAAAAAAAAASAGGEGGVGGEAEGAGRARSTASMSAAHRGRVSRADRERSLTFVCDDAVFSVQGRAVEKKGLSAAEKVVSFSDPFPRVLTACCWCSALLVSPLQSTVSEGATASRRRATATAAGAGAGAGATPRHAGGGGDDRRLRQQHASAEEAMAMVAAWTPSLLHPGGGGRGRGGQGGRRQGEREGSAGGSGRGSGRGGGGRVPRTDSQYFFSSHGSSARGMSPAGMDGAVGDTR